MKCWNLKWVELEVYESDPFSFSSSKIFTKPGNNPVQTTSNNNSINKRKGKKTLLRLNSKPISEKETTAFISRVWVNTNKQTSKQATKTKQTNPTHNDVFVAIVIDIYGGAQPLEVFFILHGDVFVFGNDLLFISWKKNKQTLLSSKAELWRHKYKINTYMYHVCKVRYYISQSKTINFVFNQDPWVMTNWTERLRVYRLSVNHCVNHYT